MSLSPPFSFKCRINTFLTGSVPVRISQVKQFILRKNNLLPAHHRLKQKRGTHNRSAQKLRFPNFGIWHGALNSSGTSSFLLLCITKYYAVATRSMTRKSKTGRSTDTLPQEVSCKKYAARG